MTGTIQDYIETGRALNRTRRYNGFTWEERIAVNPAQRKLRAQRGNPLQCHVSGFSDPSDPKGRG